MWAHQPQSLWRNQNSQTSFLNQMLHCWKTERHVKWSELRVSHQQFFLKSRFWCWARNFWRTSFNNAKKSFSIGEIVFSFMLAKKKIEIGMAQKVLLLHDSLTMQLNTGVKPLNYQKLKLVRGSAWKKTCDNTQM